jgi:hypothetical protein
MARVRNYSMSTVSKPVSSLSLSLSLSLCRRLRFLFGFLPVVSFFFASVAGRFCAMMEGQSLPRGPAVLAGNHRLCLDALLGNGVTSAHDLERQLAVRRRVVMVVMGVKGGFALVYICGRRWRAGGAGQSVFALDGG